MPSWCGRPIADVEAVAHFAAQVAVTTSVTDPRTDFEINVLGSFNVLEAARLSGNNPHVIYSSTNKVYGGLEDVPTIELETRYAFDTLPLGRQRERAARFPFPLRVLEGRGRPVFPRLLPHLRAADHGISAVVHLRSAADGGRGSGMGGLVHHRAGHRQADDHLRRRQAGTRSAVHRRPAERLRCRLYAARPFRRTDLQHGRRDRELDFDLEGVQADRRSGAGA